MATGDKELALRLIQSIRDKVSPYAKLRDLFERRWYCGVTASGYGCTPDDPHDGWGCEMRWIVPSLTDRQAQDLGLDTEGT